MANRRKPPAETPQNKPPTPTLGSTPWLAPAVVLIVAVVATFIRVSGSDFVFWDDQTNVFQNPYLNQWSTANLAFLWTHPYFKLYIPVSYTLYALIAQTARLPHLDSSVTDLQALLNPHPFHVANIILHVLNCLLVYAILRRLTSGASGPSLVGALLFAVHPVQVESVAWISELRGLLCGFFCLASISVYLRAVSGPAGDQDIPLRSPFYWLSLLLTAAALLSKPSAAALPIGLFVLDRWSIGRPIRACALSALPLVLIVVPFIAVTNGAQHLPAAVTPAIWARPFIACDALAFYLAKLFMPVALNMDYGRRPMLVLQHGWCYATSIAPVAVASLIFLRRKKYPFLIAGTLFSLAFLLPVLGLAPFIYQMHSTVADRYLYIAMLGPSMIVAILLSRLARQTATDNRTRLTTAYVACGLVLSVFAVMTFIQLGHWYNSRSLFSYSVSVSATDPEVLTNYGSVLHDHGDLADAVNEYRAAIAIDKNYMLAHTNLGMALMEEGDTTDAMYELKTVVQVDPSNADAHRNLAGVLLKIGDNAAALPEIAQATQLDPTNALNHSNYGYVLMTLGRNAEAVNEYEKALSLAPSMLPAYLGLGTVQTKLGRYADAEATYQQALQVAPGNPTVQASLDDLLKRTQSHP